MHSFTLSESTGLRLRNDTASPTSPHLGVRHPCIYQRLQLSAQIGADKVFLVNDLRLFVHGGAAVPAQVILDRDISDMSDNCGSLDSSPVAPSGRTLSITIPTVFSNLHGLCGTFPESDRVSDASLASPGRPTYWAA